MAIFKCKMCGGNLNIQENSTVAECEFCGTQQTLPKTTDENIQALFNRANLLRQKNEFDKAEAIYEKILEADSTEAEAYWGNILCKFGIEYVEDPKTYKRIPTCHRTSYDSIVADEYYKKALENADVFQRGVYEAEAKVIDGIQKDILAISAQEEPYDVFICYKETDEKGKRTQDSVIANDIYYQLTQEGFKVFYAAITLEDKLGSAYEPIIFAALNSSKVMLSIGTKPEYFSAVWVKNEWSRFLKMMKNDRSKMLIPCYKEMDAYELPEEFAHLQAQDMGKIGFINDIVRGIKKVIVKDEPKQTIVVKETDVTTENTNVAPWLKRGFLFLEDSKWADANEYSEKVLDIDPECAEAYLIQLLAKLKVKRKTDLQSYSKPFSTMDSYKKIERFGNKALVNELKQYDDAIRERNKKKAKIIKKATIISAASAAVLALLIIFVIIPFANFWSGNYGKYIDFYKIEDFEVPKGTTEIKSYTFENCGSLKSVTIPNSVTSIGDYAFRNCPSLTSVAIGEGVTSIGFAAFCGCDSLTSVVLPDSVKTIGEDAFYNCESLKSVVIGKGVKSIGYYAFSDCPSLTSITVKEGNTSYKSIDGNLYSYDGKTLIQYAVGKTNKSFVVPDGVESIGSSAFAYCTSLKSVVLPDSVTSISSWAFNNCDSLEYNEYDNAYYLGNDTNPYLVLMEAKSTSISSCNINPNTKIIGDCAFSNCKYLGSVVIPDSVTIIDDYAFRYCDYLTSVVIGKGVTIIGDSAFYSCDYLTSVVIPDNVTSIGDYAFSYCDSLTSVIIGDGVTSIGYMMFSDCDSLKSVVIGDGVTSIGDYAFSYCDSLTSVLIPDSVTSIGFDAFYWCDSLKIYCEASSQPIGWNSYWNPENRPVVWGYTN